MKRVLYILLGFLVMAAAVVFAQIGSSDIELTTDTQGLDFGPYVQQVSHKIKQHWYTIIPKSAMPPLLKRGKVVIECAIEKNGQVTRLHSTRSSGDVELDRAAYGGITASNPFPPLPSEFSGSHLGLRMTFRYNVGKLVRIMPTSVNVRAGSSLQFSPVLDGVTDAKKFPISWSVVSDCAPDACGTISQTGMYTAPPTVPKGPMILVEAKADAVDDTASAIVTILPPEPSQNNGPK